MLSIPPFAILLFAAQVGVGSYVSVSLSSANWVARVTIGILTAGLCFIILFVFGLLMTLILDIIILIGVYIYKYNN